MTTPKQPAEGSQIVDEEIEDKKVTAEELRSKRRATRQAELALESAKAKALKKPIIFC